jgi:hypothetical protein
VRVCPYARGSSATAPRTGTGTAARARLGARERVEWRVVRGGVGARGRLRGPGGEGSVRGVVVVGLAISCVGGSIPAPQPHDRVCTIRLNFLAHAWSTKHTNNLHTYRSLRIVTLAATNS